MTPLPTDPLALNDRLIAAVCADIINPTGLRAAEVFVKTHRTLRERAAANNCRPSE